MITNGNVNKLSIECIVMGIKINLQKFTSMKNEQHQRSIVQYYHFSTNYPQSSTLFIRCINKKKKKIILKKVSANIINFINIKSNFPSSIVLSQTFDGNPPAPSFEFNFPISDCFLSAFSPRKTGPCPRLPAEFVLTVVRTLN